MLTVARVDSEPLLCVAVGVSSAAERARVGTEGWQGSASLADIFCKP